MAIPFFFSTFASNMKYTMYNMTLVGLMAILLSACSGNNNAQSVKFECIKVEKSVSIDNNKDAPQCHVQLEIMQANNGVKEIDSIINDAIIKKIFYMDKISPKVAADSFAQTYTRDYLKNMSSLYHEDRSDAKKHSWYEYRYVVTTETRNDADNITNYLITLDYYEGGAHGINQLLTLNFDNKTGRNIKLSDIYGTDYEQKICNQLLTALLEKTGNRDLQALHQQGYLYSMDIFVPDNYIVSNDKVTFIFNPYEIAPYSEGIIELEVER